MPDRTTPTRRRPLAALVLILVGVMAAACAPAAEPSDPPVPSPDTLLSPGSLHAEQSIRSSSGFTFAMNGDGNAVLYRPTATGSSPVWATNTNGHPGARIVLQEDGNLVVYDTTDRVLWSNQKSGSAGSYLVMRADGNLVQYVHADGARTAVWSTGTGGDRNGAGCPAGENFAICERSATQARTDTAARAIKFAIRQVGVPYSTAGRFGTSGYDCSGLMWQAYASSGIDIGANVSSTIIAPGGPRRSVAMGEVRPGDMVWYPGHIAMELADGRIVEAAKPGTNVRIVGSAHRGFTRAVTIDAP